MNKERVKKKKTIRKKTQNGKSIKEENPDTKMSEKSSWMKTQKVKTIEMAENRRKNRTQRAKGGFGRKPRTEKP